MSHFSSTCSSSKNFIITCLLPHFHICVRIKPYKTKRTFNTELIPWCRCKNWVLCMVFHTEGVSSLLGIMSFKERKSCKKWLIHSSTEMYLLHQQFILMQTFGVWCANLVLQFSLFITLVLPWEDDNINRLLFTATFRLNNKW